MRCAESPEGLQAASSRMQGRADEANLHAVDEFAWCVVSDFTVPFKPNTTARARLTACCPCSHPQLLNRHSRAIRERQPRLASRNQTMQHPGEREPIGGWCPWQLKRLLQPGGGPRLPTTT